MTVPMSESGLPRVPVGDWIERAFDWVNENLSAVFNAIDNFIQWATSTLTDLLVAPPALVLAVIFAGLAFLVRGWKLAVGSLLGLAFIISVDQWPTAMETLAVVVVATVLALLIGIPVGVLAARYARVSSAVRPVMDLMQTMPAFVWLVPVVVLFGLGLTPGVIATVIFALPPGVRLTELGIRQVDPEVVEAGHAFGSSNGQILRGIQVPLAMPTIMAGVNQVIMLALSMAVIAGLVGAGGLGGQVTTAISRLDVGLGFEAGLSVVALAIYLDRVTAAIGKREPGKRSLLRRRPRSSGNVDEVAVEKERSRRTPARAEAAGG